jgi:hypothetical protein
MIRVHHDEIQLLRKRRRLYVRIPPPFVDD